MHDTGKVIAGIVIFLIVVLLPIWFSAAGGGLGEAPEIDPGEGSCVLSAEDMMSSHMELLDDWRDAVVRENDREMVPVGDEMYPKSLTKTCLNCHAYQDFCKKCHDYMGVEPNCYDCHLRPGVDFDAPQQPGEE